MHEGTVKFDQIVKESPYLVVDGELPWGFWSVGADPDSPSAGWIIDGVQAARRLYNSNVTAFNTAVKVFPSSIVAKSQNAAEREFFVAEEIKRGDVVMKF